MNPDFVCSMQTLLTDIYGTDIHIKTPHINKTKKEVLEIAKQNLKDNFDFAVQKAIHVSANNPMESKQRCVGGVMLVFYEQSH